MSNILFKSVQDTVNVSLRFFYGIESIKQSNDYFSKNYKFLIHILVKKVFRSSTPFVNKLLKLKHIFATKYKIIKNILRRSSSKLCIISL